MFGNKLHTIIILEKIMQVLVIHYDQARDAFIAPKPFNSWILNEDTCRWEAPVAMPELTQEQIDNRNYYAWNEQIKNWEKKYGALDDGSLTGGCNTAIGTNALTANTSGAANVALGITALCSKHFWWF
jgi:hypothetical protein